jgi:ribose 5-phosphate isomerase B|tara:strand:- start:122 stop:568 length:447 start_codon:yes stop_codon:yes gene_type:complete
MKKIIIGSDHAGFKLKEDVKKFLKNIHYKVKDCGTDSEESVDYPNIGKKVAKDVAKEKCFGILICGSGIGMSIVANKVKGIRAALCHDENTAEVARKHNNSNILCLGSRVLEDGDAKRIVKRYLETEFSDEERHKRRVDEIKDIECSS